VRVETAAGVYFTKLRGAGQGRSALVAEIIVAGLAQTLGLRVPPMALIALEEGVETLDRDGELADLLRASHGLNLGFRYLPDARDFRPTEVEAVGPEIASTIVWLDGLVQNPDRTPRNPNLLWCRKELWLIDHGASLGFQHDWAAVTEAGIRRSHDPRAGHLLGQRAERLAELDDRLAALLPREALHSVVATVPDEYLASMVGPDPPGRRREAYVAVLWKRLQPPRPFVLPERV
jgi:HipA-like kinase